MGQMKHGYRCNDGRNKTYRAWVAMRNRCNNPNQSGYKNWGGRGIRVCKRWDSFVNFLADMGEAPLDKSLDRKNGNKGYSKSNCRWATTIQQALNRRLPPVGKYGRGVGKSGKRFYARTIVNYEYIYIGSFKTAKEAHEAYEQYRANLPSEV